MKEQRGAGEKTISKKKEQICIYDAMLQRLSEDDLSRLIPLLDLKTIYSTRLQRLFKEMKGGGKMLDMGCGTCWYSINAARYGYDITGMDISGYAVKIGKKVGKGLGDEICKKCDFLLGDAENPPFKEESFDCILYLNILEHLPDPETGIKEISRVLKPGGCVILATDLKKGFLTLDWLHKKITPKRYKARQSRWGHDEEKFFDLDELKEMLGREGLLIEETVYTESLVGLLYDSILLKLVFTKNFSWFMVKINNYILFPIIRLFSVIDPVLEHFGFAGAVGILAKKEEEH